MQKPVYTGMYTYTKPLEVNRYEITPARPVPEEIIRPPYVN